MAREIGTLYMLAWSHNGEEESSGNAMYVLHMSEIAPHLALAAQYFPFLVVPRRVIGGFYCNCRIWTLGVGPRSPTARM